MSADFVLNEFLENTPLSSDELEKLMKFLQRVESKPEMIKDVALSLRLFIESNPKENIKTLVKSLQRKFSELKKPQTESDVTKTTEKEVKDKLLAHLFRQDSIELADKIKIVESAKVFIQRYDPKKVSEVAEDRQPLVDLLNTCNTKDLIVKLLMKEEATLKKDLTAPIEVQPDVYLYIESLECGGKNMDVLSNVLSVCIADPKEAKCHCLTRPFDKLIRLTFEQLDSYSYEEKFVYDLIENESVDVVFDYETYREVRVKEFVELTGDAVFGKIDDLFEILKAKKCVAVNNAGIFKKLSAQLRFTNIQIKSENLDVATCVSRIKAK
jgi:hypothetical protein